MKSDNFTRSNRAKFNIVITIIRHPYNNHFEIWGSNNIFGYRIYLSFKFDCWLPKGGGWGLLYWIHLQLMVWSKKYWHLKKFFFHKLGQYINVDKTRSNSAFIHKIAWKKDLEISRLYGLALNERTAKIAKLWNSFSQIWN
jgi:hypothetical protein